MPIRRPHISGLWNPILGSPETFERHKDVWLLQAKLFDDKDVPIPSFEAMTLSLGTLWAKNPQPLLAI